MPHPPGRYSNKSTWTKNRDRDEEKNRGPGHGRRFTDSCERFSDANLTPIGTNRRKQLPDLRDKITRGHRYESDDEDKCRDGVHGDSKLGGSTRGYNSDKRKVKHDDYVPQRSSGSSKKQERESNYHGDGSKDGKMKELKKPYHLNYDDDNRPTQKEKPLLKAGNKHDELPNPIAHDVGLKKTDMMDIDVEEHRRDNQVSSGDERKVYKHDSKMSLNETSQVFGSSNRLEGNDTYSHKRIPDEVPIGLKSRTTSADKTNINGISSHTPKQVELKSTSPLMTSRAFEWLFDYFVGACIYETSPDVLWSRW
ncbi:hypothetical protein HDU76_010327 [Blyttiomyces sp. JEL0837]|nr:hypothetical protein HDU76_010327 [Blyttiomyces sp. JEL0837]